MKTEDRHSGIAGAQGLGKESSAARALPVLKGVEHRFVDLPELRMHVEGSRLIDQPVEKVFLPGGILAPNRGGGDC